MFGVAVLGGVGHVGPRSQTLARDRAAGSLSLTSFFHSNAFQQPQKDGGAYGGGQLRANTLGLVVKLL